MTFEPNKRIGKVRVEQQLRSNFARSLSLERYGIMNRYSAMLLVVGVALGACSGCRQQNAAAVTGEAWEYYAHGDPRVTLNRWARVGLDDNDEIYYIDFHAEDKVTDENLFIVRDLNNLKLLDLRGTQVTDIGLKYVRGLTKLEVLRLPDGVSDAGLFNLRQIEDLKEIYISPNSGVTSVGVDQLKGWFPDAKIYFTEIFRL